MMATMTKQTYIRISIAAVIVLAVAGGVWYWYSQRAPSLDDAGTAAISIAPLASVSPLAVAYDAVPAGWKTYASASAGFKVSYPADWTPGACGTGCVGWAPVGAEAGKFEVGIVRSTGTLEEILKSAEPFMAGKEEIKAGANTWLKLTLQHPATGDIITSHFIAHNGKLFEFGTASSDAKVLESYGKMIASFVFTK